jgi:ankyrin repeat protein
VFQEYDYKTNRIPEEMSFDEEDTRIEKIFRAFERADYDAGLALAAEPGGSEELWYTGWNALACAVWTNAPHHVIMSLLNPKAANIQDSQGRTVLHLALYKCQPAATVLAILHAHPAAAAVKDSTGLLPIFLAVYGYTDISVYHALHTAFPGDVEARDHKGNTLLHHAALMGSAITANVLAANPDAARVKNNDDYLPLQIFCKDAVGDSAVFHMLYNAYPEAVFYEHERTRETAVHMAMQNLEMTWDINSALMAANPSAAKKKYKGLRHAPVDFARAHFGFVGVI